MRRARREIGLMHVAHLDDNDGMAAADPHSAADRDRLAMSDDGMTLDEAPADRSSAMDRDSVSPPVMLGGVSVPGYDLLKELGRGGMGGFYKARHLRLKRLVALKMILAADHAGHAQALFAPRI